jgi:hypothetical protein
MARERGWCCDLGYRPKRFSDEPEYAAGWGVRTVGAKGSPGSPGLELEESEEMRGAPPAPKTEKAGSGADLSDLGPCTIVLRHAETRRKPGV